jgi:hypothetical protein
MPVPAAPFIMAGVAAALLAASQLLKDLGLDGSQSQKNSGNTVVRADSFRPPVVTKPDPKRNLPSGLDTQDGSYSWPGPSQKSNTQTQPQTVAGTTSAPAAPTPTPTQAAEPPLLEPGPSPEYAGVKAAPIDTVVFVDEPFDENYYEDVLFQDFGGQELLTVARNDTVNGQNISYQPFKDLGIIRDQYTPNSLLSIQETSDRFFANFLIRLNEKIPGVGNGPSGSNVYLEEGQTGSAIIEFINIEANEQVEIQILNAGIIEDIGI